MEPQNNVMNTKGDNKIFGILSYLGPLVLISLLTKKDDPAVKFHVKQGLVLFCIEIILSILMAGMMLPLWELYSLIRLAILVLSIIGIINVVQGREKSLPVVGGLARYFTF